MSLPLAEFFFRFFFSSCGEAELAAVGHILPKVAGRTGSTYCAAVWQRISGGDKSTNFEVVFHCGVNTERVAVRIYKSLWLLPNFSYRTPVVYHHTLTS